MFWKSRDAYSSWSLVTKSSSPVKWAFVPLIAEGLIIRSSLSDGGLLLKKKPGSAVDAKPGLSQPGTVGRLRQPAGLVAAVDFNPR